MLAPRPYGLAGVEPISITWQSPLGLEVQGGLDNCSETAGIRALHCDPAGIIS